MKKSEIQQNLHTLSQNIEQENFIYEFLLSFGLSKTTITRLKKGDYNLSKIDGELFYKGKIFFKVEKQANLLNLIDELAKDEKIKKQKPRFIVVTDFKDVLAVDTKLGNNKEFSIEQLGEQTDFFLPLSGAEIYRVSNDNKLDRDAAYKLGELYDILVVDNPHWIAQGSHQLNIFLSRLLFCFFAEDTGIFEVKSIFTESLANNTKKDGSDVDLFLTTLFKKLNTPEGKGSFEPYFDKFPYVNGGLFRDDIQCPKFSTKARQILLDSGELDWSEINPDIFGSMIQAVADPSERNNLGMHYTSVVNILKLIKPLFLDELYDELEKNKGKIKGLEALLNRLGKIKFFDPACGSGNFLIITYKELRNLEIQIIKELLDLNATQRKIYFSEIKLSQFYGIEIKDFAHEMAILSLWLAEHQMNQVFELELLDYGKSNPILPLKESGNITAGNAARVDWEIACPKKENDEIYIIGNPPYLGSRNQDTEQKSDMELVFKKDYKSLDYVSIWFYKGAKYIEEINAQLAFVSTNSICQGLLVALTWPRILTDKLEIGFAYQSFKWINNAKGNAGVTVIIVGLRNYSTNPKYIFTESIAKEVKNINSYLIDGNNIFIGQQNKSISNFPSMNFGNMPADGGNLLFTPDEKEELILNNPLTKKYFKKVIGSTELINGIERWCLWFENEDFDELNKIDELKNIFDKIRVTRNKSSRPKLADIPHLFAQITQNTEKDFIIIPSVSSERRRYIPIDFLSKDNISTNLCMIISDAQPWLFGVLHSKMHMIWVDAVGGKLKTDYRYSAKLCYNTFPFPTLSEKKKETINQYVFAILDERAKYPEKTMAWMYNPETMPSGLKQAHKELDLAIEQIYRLAPFYSDEERLEYLFKLYDEMTTKETLFAKPKKKTTKK
ncbi:putative DNA methyltransferase YeeA [Empedobacter brevis NBRC 14943 = ATCC 43319]|uniref:site-specific DNA-methyltransferase (adenine-specific) n=1 Tax=Empedobacter brevis NBRC 14943 = ATCC 43319 TaxID=1218108 RepID=A0A511NIG3_9FLAO|nr:DNA methyltransferase [Empedobacter brevis]GEM52592.1 putative DNA methyltransferase YeeA [Empedobacter brevis NBRC 14943 = ATCC 43319]